jgi:signal peptidase I
MPGNDRPTIILRRGARTHTWRIEPGQAIAAPRPSRRENWYARARFATTVAIAMSLAVLAVQSSVKGFEAHGVSMEPGLHDGDHIFVNRLAYSQVDLGILDWSPVADPSARWSYPSRGDIIVFKAPIGGSALVKRVIGLPHEYVEITRGRVIVDGRELIEPYVTTPTGCGSVCSWDIPAGYYLVLGDNRADSRDSREGWTVPVANIIGKKLLTY